MARARLILFACSLTHFATDGLVAALYPLLPLIASELYLSYGAVGSLRTAIVGSGSLFQLPASYAAAWVGETALLGWGTAWMAAGFATMALAGGFWHLFGLTFVAGIGNSPQHPLASAVVSRAYEHSGRATALSILNFAGDVGKFVFPAAAGVLAITFGWRVTLVFLAALAAVAAVVFALMARDRTRSSQALAKARMASATRIPQPVAFAVLSAIGAIDNGTRASALTFLPFLLAERGFDAAAVSMLVTLVFGAGAAGKFGCGLMADRWGTTGVIVITEAITAGALLAIIPFDNLLVIPVLAAFGFVLNGTSSALYAMVAEMVPAEARARGFGIFYTVSLGIGTSTPVVYGALADRVGVVGCVVAIAAVNLLTLPMALALRRVNRIGG